MNVRLTTTVIVVLVFLFVYLRQAVIIRREEYGIKELVDSCEVLEMENRALAVQIERLRSFPRLERMAAERGFESLGRRHREAGFAPLTGVRKRR